MRNSKQRSLILDIINKSTSHPSAEDIYIECRKHFPNISLGTVYRNLNLLVSLNEITKITCGDREHFDKREEHHHFICQKCNKIVDIYDIKISKINELNGNIVEEQVLMLKGICKSCQE